MPTAYTEGRRTRVAALGVVLAALGTACAGSGGKDGTNGAPCTVADNGNGTSTITCPDGSRVIVANAVVDYAVMTPAELAASDLAASVTSVAIPADGRPVVSLRLTERHGLGVKGVASWRFSLLKLADGVNGSASETWVSYLAADATSPATLDAGGTLTDHGDGTYAYRFAKVVTAGVAAAGTTYEPARVHRLVVLLAAPGNPFSPVNVVKDFVPATGADVTGSHEKVDAAACAECHGSFRPAPGAAGPSLLHGTGALWDVRTCVACHNDQRRFTPLGAGIDGDADIAVDGSWPGLLAVLNGEAVSNYPVLVHKLHMGTKLTMTGGAYATVYTPYSVTYPQDVRQCDRCHRGPAPMAGTWLIPTRRACGACHDGRSFVNPPPPGRVLHSGGPMADDASCLVCHGPGGIGGDAPTDHRPVAQPDPNNVYSNASTGRSDTSAAWVAAGGYVPPGARAPTYEVQSVGLDGSRHPQIAFRLLLADPNAVPPVPPAPVVFQAPGLATELVPGFVGSPSLYFAYAVPQDALSAPADFNVVATGYLRAIWNGTATGAAAGTLSGPDGSGFYTVTLTGVTIPFSAGMLTGGIGYGYGLGAPPTFASNTQPLTQTDLPRYPYTPNPSGFAGSGGLVVPAPDVWRVATGYTGRRAVVATQRCNGCHATLGVSPSFHAGQGNDAASCAFCHRPNLTSGGWSANAKDAVHAIHGAGTRTIPFTWRARSLADGFQAVTYPGTPAACEACHLPGTYDFSAPAAAAALPDLLFSTVGLGRYDASQIGNPAAWFTVAPYVDGGNLTDYGYGFATANVVATLPDGNSGTQGATACTPASPCACSAASPCSVTISSPYTVNNVAVTFTQRIGGVTTTCNGGTPCTCTTAAPCTGIVAACSTAAPCQAQGTTLVSSPIAAACVACHDGPAAFDHMQSSGASLWEARSVAFAKPQREECLLCHGSGRIADIAAVHGGGGF